LPPFSDPDLIGTWIEDNAAILFFHQPKDDLVHALCEQSGAEVVYQADLACQDWEAGVKITSFLTKYLHVRPIWEASASDSERMEILLDPSVVFGSGFHATTRLCLAQLELLLRESGRKINKVLDLGTGTGLLAVAAAKLGAEQVTALDCNPLAVQVARRNAVLNGCEDRIEVRQFDLMQALPDMNYDLIISNLYKGLLLRLCTASSFWQPRSLYLISGFLPSMEPELLAALPAKQVQMLQRGSAEPWRYWLIEFGRTESGG
jgi:ribosomal protein L11 methyltransferase